MIEIARSEAGKLCAQFDSDVVGHVRKRVGIGQLAHLIGDGQGHLFAAQADVGAPHAADGIEEAVAIGVVDVGALAFDDIQRALLGMLIEHVVAVQVVGFVGRHQGIIGGGCYEGFVWRGHGSVLG
ncbi:hypothetical protein D3C78_642600 [compost metagenome]